MGADVMMTALKGLPFDARGADSDPIAPYRRVIDEASAEDVAAALVWDTGGFQERLDEDEAERFKDLLDYLSDADVDAITEFAGTPVLVAKAREHLTEAAELIYSRYVSVFTIGGFEVLVAGGMASGGEPFDGFDSLQALSDLLDFTGHGIGRPAPVWVLTFTEGGGTGRSEVSVFSSEKRARDGLYRRVVVRDSPRVPDERDQLIGAYFAAHPAAGFTLEEASVDC
ncbi:hypothetical protein [Gordonia sihwensis]|uniref:hypothetical protein n=1 Tax=Gordonia sihwensis TaxID=173559 RepID=UPI0005F09253|nr:hypothetical protein [Gordonia sihwensis]KJR10516.1 hypothetical protein UG54_00525 [Gordonia sihwensis]